MAAGVVLDTSFLITLLDHSRAHYKTADRYWEYFAEQRFPVYLSTIVVSEFCIHQEIPTAIRKNCVPLVHPVHPASSIPIPHQTKTCLNDAMIPDVNSE